MRYGIKGMLQLWGVCLLAECKVKRRWRGSIIFPISYIN